ncbi:Ser/Thr protein kinase [Cryptosporidium canis]|uniref:Ser/Thr protein kinase n=1 Tax=Cryptosporidium canis TaxID=195482 RepID=A0ABQ8P7Z5_9CRYT|nr:Ser/Thr protein kinase [Cryptosporidium canis]
MAVVTRKNVKISPKNPTKVKSQGSIGKSSQITRGRTQARVIPEVKHNSISPHPTRCLRGVSTRATFKRSPSPRKDWPFDEATLYPPHPRVGSPTASFRSRSSNSHVQTSTQKKNSRTNNSSQKSAILHNPVLNNNAHHSGSPVHHLHPTRCLRGVSTRATFKRSPSPRKDWPFDEATLYPPHPRVGSPKAPQNKTKKLSPVKKASRNVMDKNKSPKKSIKTISNRSNNSTKPKKSSSTTTIKQVSPGPKSKNRGEIIYHGTNKQSKDTKICRFNMKTESIATVLDGEEEYIQSPVTSVHIGWGGKQLNNCHWNNKLSGKNVIQVSRAVLWNEVHNGSIVWKPHKCINDFRLVSHSRELYNPYNGSSKLQVAEYIWQFKEYYNKTSPSHSDFPPLFELLFVKKDSLFSSILGRLYSNPLSHESISRELFSQSLLAYHKNFVRINEVIQDQSYQFSVFVMEYLPFSSMNWNPETQSYQAPSIYSSKDVSNKVYTYHGSKLIFSEVLKAVKFLHSKEIAGIYIMPESIKLSHSFDETYVERSGIDLTRQLHDRFSGFKKVEYPVRNNHSKIEVDSELSKYWSSAKSINISNEYDSATIHHVNSIIQEKRTQGINVQDDSFLFDPMPFLEELQDFYDNNSIHQTRYEKGTLLVKLGSPFKGMGSKHKETLFSGNKWLSPPELFNRMFSTLNQDVDLRKCDIWNLGILLHCLLVGVPPTVVNNHVLIDKRVPSEARGLLSSILSMDPLLRPSIFEIEEHIIGKTI